MLMRLQGGWYNVSLFDVPLEFWASIIGQSPQSTKARYDQYRILLIYNMNKIL